MNNKIKFKHENSIRKIKLSDLEKCAEILEKSYNKPPYNEKFASGISYKYLKRKFDYCAENSFVIEEDKNVIGFIMINLSYWNGGWQAIIEEIVIDEDKHGQGYGNDLIKYAEDHLGKIGVKSLMLWCRKDADAFEFYLKKGFVEDEIMAVMFKNFDE